MRNEVLIALLSKIVEEKLAELSSNKVRGPRGPRGQRGKDGEDGLSFVWADHEETIRGWVDEAALEFDDLTDDQISALRGPRGHDGKRGESFVYETHREKIGEIISAKINEISGELKLKFSDLEPEEISQLRGPRGHDGRSFRFEEHIEFFESLKPKFSDFSEEERASLVLKFSDLTDEEKSDLKLNFSDLTDEDRFQIRGPRGQRGKPGAEGIQGEVGPGGRMGPRGLPGPMGIRGLPGPMGIGGADGVDGADAPWISDINLVQDRNNQIHFVFKFSDGSQLTTQSIDLPVSQNIWISGGVGGGGSGTGNGEPGADGADGADGTNGTDGADGADGADGQSAYQLWIALGNVGTESDFSDSLQGADGSPGTDGADGSDGADGVDGDPGAPGTPGIQRSIFSISSNQTLGSDPMIDYVYFITGNVDVTMPTAVGNTNRYSIKNSGSGLVNILFSGIETGDGETTLPLPRGESSLDLLSDNSNWGIF